MCLENKSLFIVIGMMLVDIFVPIFISVVFNVSYLLTVIVVCIISFAVAIYLTSKLKYVSHIDSELNLNIKDYQDEVNGLRCSCSYCNDIPLNNKELDELNSIYLDDRELKTLNKFKSFTV